MNRVRTEPSHPRRGAALVVAVVLLAVTIALLAAAAKTAGLHARGAGPAEDGVRAGLLADAAARLARRRLAADPGFTTFDWRPAAGAATVTVDHAGDGRSRVAVVATTADGAARATRSFTVSSSSADLPAARR